MNPWERTYLRISGDGGEARLLVKPASHLPGLGVRLSQQAAELLEVLKPLGARSGGAGLPPGGVQRSLPSPATERSSVQGCLCPTLSESDCGDNIPGRL